MGKNSEYNMRWEKEKYFTRNAIKKIKRREPQMYGYTEVFQKETIQCKMPQGYDKTEGVHYIS